MGLGGNVRLAEQKPEVTQDADLLVAYTSEHPLSQK